MNMSVMNLFFLFLTMFAFSAHAENVPSRAPSRTVSNVPTKCKGCQQLERMLRGLEAIRLDVTEDEWNNERHKEQDKNHGYSVLSDYRQYVSKASEIFGKPVFNHEEFDMFVFLVAVGDPAVSETLGADALARLIDGSPALNQEYLDTLPKLDSCYLQDLKYRMDLMYNQIHPDRPPHKENEPIDLVQCLKAKKTH